MKCALVVGGASGLGLAMVRKLLEEKYEKIYVADRVDPPFTAPEIEPVRMNLVNSDFSALDSLLPVDTLIITAGFGRLCLFEDLTEAEIVNSFRVNSLAAIRIIKRYYDRLLSAEPFRCAVIGSIAGLIASPMFSVYSATKAAICKFTEAVNTELEKSGTPNRILNVSPGSIAGTSFNGARETDLDGLRELAQEIFSKMEQKETLYIPNYDEVYRRVLQNFADDPHGFALDSFDYKLKSGRMRSTPQVKVGYLTGTFDLFHIGHLNLLKRAKQYCDYLIVGVHKDASHKGKKTYISFEERMEIVKSIRYVDRVVESKPEDIDAYPELHYDLLFVGSDYKGTERFRRYEEYFADKNVKIIYFPYTDGTSSTKLRAILEQDLASLQEDQTK